MHILEKHEPREYGVVACDGGVVLCDSKTGAFLVLRFPEDLTRLQKLLNSMDVKVFHSGGEAVSTGFKLTCGSATLLRAQKAADDLEQAVGEIANGQRESWALSVEDLAVLVQFVRNTSCEQAAKVPQ